MKTPFKFTFLIIVFFINNLFAQQFASVELPDYVKKEYLSNNDAQFDAIKSKYFKNAVDITSYLPNGYSTLGTVDYTQYLQKGIDNNAIVVLPNFPIAVNYNGLKLKSNSKILFQPQTLLKLLANNKDTYQILLFDAVENADVYFANIEGDRKNHLGNDGEWGMGIWIKHSKNINLFSPKISDCWGDGIYIGNQKKISSENIAIKNAYLNNNRRNGISIISGGNITVENSVIINTNGTEPQAGIDIEPNTNDDEIKNVVIRNVYTANNVSRGVLLVFDNLIGANPKDISVTIDKHKDVQSGIALEFYVDRGYQKSPDNKLSGKISVTNSHYERNLKNAITNNLGKTSNISLSLGKIYILNNQRKMIKMSNKKNREMMEAFKNGRKLIIN